MNLKVPIYSKGLLVFHLFYSWPNFVQDRAYFHISATIPKEVMLFANPSIKLKGISIQPPCKSQALLLLKDIGKNIVESKNVEGFYYPKYLAEDDILSKNYAEKVKNQILDFSPLPGTHFCSNTNAVSF
jgi:hypothetical protein